MSNIRLILIVWGAAILIYLALSNNSGTVNVLNSLGKNGTAFTRTLQGRT